MGYLYDNPRNIGIIITDGQATISDRPAYSPAYPHPYNVVRRRISEGVDHGMYVSRRRHAEGRAIMEQIIQRDRPAFIAHRGCGLRNRVSFCGLECCGAPTSMSYGSRCKKALSGKAMKRLSADVEMSEETVSDPVKRSERPAACWSIVHSRGTSMGNTCSRSRRVNKG
ncbi:hypothetical protein BDW69DRAFT_159914 [Aspergillus filifer]